MLGYNLHTHTQYSDGKSTVRETIEEAVKQKMTVMGFSDHAPFPTENTFSIRPGEMENYVNEVRSLSDEFKNEIEVLCSLEIDFVPGIIQNFNDFKTKYHLDYVIGSVHLVGKNNSDELWFIDGKKVETYDKGLHDFYDNDIQKAVKAYYYQVNEMIENEHFDIIGHFDKIKMHNQERFFHEDEKWYRRLVMETLDLIKQKNLIVEVNTRGVYKGRSKSFFPSDWILVEMHKMNIPTTISSDAHLFSELQLFSDEAIDSLKKCGYKEITTLKNGVWKNIEI